MMSDRYERWYEWEDEDPIFRQLRLTVRGKLSGALSPADAWEALTEVGVWDFGVPMEHGGLELGHAVVSMVCEETGASMHPLPLLGTLITLDALGACPSPSEGVSADLWDQVRAGKLAVPVPGRLPGFEGCLSTGVVLRDGRLNGTAGPFALGIEPGALLLLTHAGDDPQVLLLPLPAVGVEVRRLTDYGGGPTASVTFTDVSATMSLLSGAPAASWLRRAGLVGAVYQAALLTGLTTAALTAVVHRVHSRQQGGQTLVKHQAPRLRVAALMARCDAIRFAVTDTARALDRSALTPADAAGLLALVAETALEVTRDTVHLHGASGLARDSVAAACYRRVAWEALRCGRPALLWETAASRI